MTYLEFIKSDDNHCIDDIIYSAKLFITVPHYRCYPNYYMDGQGRGLNHGKSILETEEQCAAYMAAYGESHIRRLRYAFSLVDLTDLAGDFDKHSYCIFDWACGQGLGTIVALELLYKLGCIEELKEILLIEPSYIALCIADILVGKALLGAPGNQDVKPYQLSLPNVGEQMSPEVHVVLANYTQEICIHIFSNIIDIPNIDIEHLSRLLINNDKRHIIFIVEPANLNEWRIDEFIQKISIHKSIDIVSEYRNTEFGRYKSGKFYGVLIKIFKFNYPDI